MPLGTQALALALSFAMAGPTAAPPSEPEETPRSDAVDEDAPAAEPEGETQPPAEGDPAEPRDAESARPAVPATGEPAVADETTDETTGDASDSAQQQGDEPDAEDEAATDEVPTTTGVDEAPAAVPEPKPKPSGPQPDEAPPRDVSVDRHRFGAGLVGGGVAAAVLGIGLGGAMGWALAEYDASDPGSRRDSMRTIAIGTGIGAAAYLATGAVLIGFGARDLRRRRFRVGAVADGRGGGFVLSGRF